MKLNKKGFTLIELLAVIAILAILVVVAVPGVLNMYNSGKKSTFESQAKSIFKTLETTIINDSITPGNGPYSKYCFDGTTADDANGVGHLDLSGTKSIYYTATVASGKITNFKVQQVSNSTVVYEANGTTVDALTVADTPGNVISCN